MNTTDEILARIRDVQASKGDDLPDVAVALLNDLTTALVTNVWVNAKNLMGVKELSELFSVNRTTITGWAARQSSFPLPVVYLGGGPVWDAIDVIKWWTEWKTIKGEKAGTLSPHLLAGLGL